MRTSTINVKGHGHVLCVLMAGCRGARIYSPIDMPGLVVAMKREAVYLEKDSEEYKATIQYVTVKYAKAGDREKIIETFERLLERLGAIPPRALKDKE
jgi:hypothetical protein